MDSTTSEEKELLQLYKGADDRAREDCFRLLLRHQKKEGKIIPFDAKRKPAQQRPN